ncbi:hypothetical protein M408DRAFT_182657 [Serendipita vermifera MAFF 305830]|uniref:DUF7770 domain-containing protein n=1 Tax=Serendipita vermifera MAFF 305830 TaxID=933852 RepID=A0A0C2WQ01_SERVB|nr:hypothetical protein M408DRAFT_182657 [Serendipita vermifera MAFF 305830]
MADPNLQYTGVRENINAQANQFILTGSPVTSDKNSVLHWRIYVVEHSRRATVFDLTPGGSDGRTGVLMVKGVNRSASQSSKAEVVFQATKTATVAEVLGKLQSLGRTRYRYTDDGSGCRYWCETVLQDLVNEGYVGGDASATFDAFITERNALNPGVYPLPTRRGTFY